MYTGDFVLTPSWTYHDHGNPGSTPVIWMDVLDLPIVNMFDTSFAEHHPQETQPVSRNGRRSRSRDMAATCCRWTTRRADRTSSPSPVFNTRTRGAERRSSSLQRKRSRRPASRGQAAVRQSGDGGYPLATIAAFLQLLPKGFAGKAYRSTDSTILQRPSKGQGAAASDRQR
jgi:gentisate 1,2-dioxygenase